MVSSESNCNRATLPCFPAADSLQREAGEVVAVVSCSGMGVGENAPGSVLNPFWKESKVGAVVVVTLIGEGRWRQGWLGARPTRERGRNLYK
jgi:hypothetical protein